MYISILLGYYKHPVVVAILCTAESKLGYKRLSLNIPPSCSVCVYYAVYNAIYIRLWWCMRFSFSSNKFLARNQTHRSNSAALKHNKFSIYLPVCWQKHMKPNTIIYMCVCEPPTDPFFEKCCEMKIDDGAMHICCTPIKVN